MAENRGVVRTAIGVLNVLVGALAVWGGGQEAIVYWNEDPLAVGVGAAGAFVGTLFALSGIAIWRRGPEARRVGLAAAGGTILVHAAGVLFGYVGMIGLLVAVAYPAMVMAWLGRSGHGSGRTAETRRKDGRPDRDDHTLRRVKALA